MYLGIMTIGRLSLRFLGAFRRQDAIKNRKYQLLAAITGYYLGNGGWLLSMCDWLDGQTKVSRDIDGENAGY